MAQALALTVFQLTWSALWGKLHSRIRKGRSYASNDRREAGPPDALYRRLNPVLFIMQTVVGVACSWSDAAWLLKFHSSTSLRWVGASFLTLALVLTRLAIGHLRDNYSPCYDPHLPRALVTTGPYACVRHPMYLAKLMAGAGALAFSGSWWLVPSTIYLFASTARAMRQEDAQLFASLPGYAAYASRTRALFPCWP